MATQKPTIDAQPKSPFIVKGLKKLTNAKGEPLPMEKEVIALCRCGQSESKPFCDGTHRAIGFVGNNEGGGDGEAREYAGKEVTVVDHRSFCHGAGACGQGAPEVFFRREGGQRISQPDRADRETVTATIRRCPSGSLLYKVDGKLVDDYFSEAEIVVEQDGPLHVRGGIVLNDAEGRQPPTMNHYALCRCGASKNKPFCDGSHEDVGFRAG